MFRRGRESLEPSRDESSTWTVTFSVGTYSDVPMPLHDVRDESDAVETVKAWLANLNEDGTPPTAWDGWLEVDFLDHGEACHLTFRATEVKTFTVSPGFTEY